MKRKKILSFLIAMIMAIQLLPLSLLADDEEAVSELYTVTETVELDSSSLADNDELLEGYIEELFGISDNSGIMLTATYTGEDALSGTNLELYTALKSAIVDIAAGNQSSTAITISLDEDSYFTGSTQDEAVAVMNEDIDVSLIVNYLRSDCPYEMYWFGNTYQYGYGGLTYTDSSSGEVVKFEITSLTFVFYVASGYQLDGSSTTVDSSKVTAAKTAVEYAQEIASNYSSGYTDLEKLTAFKEYICDAVTYESDYDNYDYGDVWQLVYVFDQDTSTNVVCEGYSKAFQYLCDLAELECITVTGTMSGGTGAGAHMWNVVYLDGVNYLVDVTNSDSGSIGQNGGLFMVSDAEADASDSIGYTFTVSNTAISYVYDEDTLALYPSSYLTLGSETSSVTVPTFYGWALTLDGRIGVTYYFNMDEVDNPEDYSLTANIDTVAKTENKTLDGVIYYCYTVYVGVADINTTITASLTDGSNTVTVDDYSVATYCAKAIDNSRAESELCTALLTYGYYAGVYISEDTGITGYTSADDITVSIDSDTYGGTTTSGVSKNISLVDTIYIGITLSGDAASNSTVTVNGTEYTVDEDGYFEFQVSAKNLDTMYTVYDESGEVLTKYSVYSYIMNQLNESEDTNLINLLKAIYNYAEAANNYTGWH